MELAGGVWTNLEGRGHVGGGGKDYPAWRWNYVAPLLPELKGKDCLDIGCSSGFFSIKLKELGARSVLGIDEGEQTLAIDQARFAASVLGVDIDFQRRSVYDLAALGRQFEVVLFLGVFYHLRYPLLALDQIRAVCRGSLIMQTITLQHDRSKRALGAKEPRQAPFAVDMSLRSPLLKERGFPTLKFIEGSMNSDSSVWFVPNTEAVFALLRATGFSSEEVVYPSDAEVIVRCHIQ